MTHLDAATARALSDPDTLRSFATLDRHREAGRFDKARAWILLRQNARDATPHTPCSVRDAVTNRLLQAYLDR